MRKVHIIQEIDVTVFKRRGPITNWNIGVTENPERTRQTLGEGGHDVSRWQHWRADTTYDAVAIGELFTMLGMKEVDPDDKSEESAIVFVY